MAFDFLKYAMSELRGLGEQNSNVQEGVCTSGEASLTHTLDSWSIKINVNDFIVKCYYLGI